uniref:G-protein coupled receptors family 1 profile domain-containing protein n=1 Tax=Parascaris univalens TaxID=6257 RepID=A0A914ZK60_PARUN
MEEFVQTSREWMMENDITRLSMNDRKEADSVCDMLIAAEAMPNLYAENVVWWTNVFCLPLIAFVGLTCNTLNMLILTNNASTKRMPSSNLLFALALCDSCFLIFATIEVTPASISSLITSPLFNHLYIHFVLYIRTIASTFYKTSV